MTQTHGTENETTTEDVTKVLRQVNEAFRITREYVGEDTLPAIEGWTWYDADCAVRVLLAGLEKGDGDEE